MCLARVRAVRPHFMRRLPVAGGCPLMCCCLLRLDLLSSPHHHPAYHYI
jgi:hypothetical protein